MGSQSSYNNSNKFGLILGNDFYFKTVMTGSLPPMYLFY